MSDRKAAPTTAGEPSRARLLSFSLVFLAVLVLLAFLLWRATIRDYESMFARASSLVQQAAEEKDSANQLKKVNQAEPLLREYLTSNSLRHRSAAQLLLCVCLATKNKIQKDQPVADRDLAETLLARISRGECSTPELVAAANLFLEAGELSRADWAITGVFARKEDREQALRVGAQVRYQQGREQAVLNLCRELSTLKPDDPEPWRLTVRVFRDRGQWEPLGAACEKLLALAPPDSAEIRLLLIESQLETGNIVQARQEFNRVRTERPELAAQSPRIEAQLLYLEGEAGEALSLVQKARQNAPQDTALSILAGRILLEESRSDEAVKVLQAVVDQAPDSDDAHYLLGQCYARQGDQARAEEHLATHQKIRSTKLKIHELERQAGREPHNADVRRELVKLYETLGKPELAAFWNRAVESIPTN